jgi:hypothetical protein
MKKTFIIWTVSVIITTTKSKEAETGERGRTCMMHLEGEKCRYRTF